MQRSRRQLVVGVLLVMLAVVAGIAAQVGTSWKRAYDNVGQMVVPTVTLPTPAPSVDSAVATPAPEAPPEPTAVPAPDDPVNILVLGTDAREGQEVSRTDAIVVVRLDPRTNQASILSLPRDLWVKIPGYGSNRINAAYPVGEKQIGKNYGPALAKETVSNLLGLPIHHFVLINFEGFKTLIDRMGGISLDVPRAIDDARFPVDEFEGDTRTMQVHFDAGVQHLDGKTALIYARTRHADNDFGRNQRQQQVIVAIFQRARDLGILAQINSVDEYTDALRDYVRTDMGMGTMLSLATAGAQLDTANIQRYAVDSKMLVMLKEPATFAAEPTALKRLVEQMVNPQVAVASPASAK